MKKISLIIASTLFMLAACNQKTKDAAVNEEELPIAFDTHFIDSSQNPCDNFYSWAIGNWQKNNPVPSTESRWMAFNILDKENEKKLLGIVQELSAKDGFAKGSEEQLIRDFYLSGMDSNRLAELGATPLQAFLSEIDAISSLQELNEQFAKNLMRGTGAPFGFYVGADDKNSAQYITTAYQGGLSLPDRDFYLSEDEKFVTIRAQFTEHVNKMLEMGGAAGSEAGEKILKLETFLASISRARKDLRIPELNYNLMARSDWDNSLKNLDMSMITTKAGMAKADTLVVGQPDFFKQLDAYLGSSELNDWKLYLKWKTISTLADYLSPEFVKQDFAFYGTVLKGTKEMKPMNERVFAAVDGNLGEPLGKLFVKQYFPEESKTYMVGMIENLRSAYRDRIKALSWMSEETKEKALKKLEAFTYKIGYPDEWKDYSKLEINKETYLQNVLNARMYRYKMMTDKLGKPVDKKEWFMTPHMVNAYYSSSGNEIVFPAGILQPPFFHPSFDHAINYGGIGAVIGHEFTHGFDDQGSKYDWNGNLNNWWTAEDLERFNALGKALADQYSTYSPIEGMHVNGEMTLGENIADLGGLTLAYEALKKELNGKEPAAIDGFSWQQRFFLGWANVWKGNITTEELKNRLLTDYHSPAEYRVLGPLVNLKTFEEAFGCKEGPMYKADSLKIKIW